MSPTTPIRVKDGFDSSSPRTVQAPVPMVPPQRFFHTALWMDQQREQQTISIHKQNFQSTGEFSSKAGPTCSNKQNFSNLTPTLPIAVPQRAQSVASSTTLDQNLYPAVDTSFDEQDDNHTTLEHILSTPGDDVESQSEYVSDLENQRPADAPSTPPIEYTSRRSQRRPLLQFFLDGYGRPLHTNPNQPEASKYNSFARATHSDINEDTLDTDSNASTVVLPEVRKRCAGHFDDDDKENSDATGKHILGTTKRLKTGPDDFDSPKLSASMEKELQPMRAVADNDEIDSAQQSDSASTTTTVVMKTTRKRSASQIQEEEGNAVDEQIRADSPCPARIKRRKSPQETIDIDSWAEHVVKKTKLDRGGNMTSSNRTKVFKTQSPIPAKGRFYATSARSIRPQHSKRSFKEASLADYLANTEASTTSLNQEQSPVSGHRAPPSTPNVLNSSTLVHSCLGMVNIADVYSEPESHLQEQTSKSVKEATLLSPQQIRAAPTPEPVNAILDELEEAEEGFACWLAEVRNKKNHYRRIMHKQKVHRKAIEEDRARLAQLEPTIKAVAAEELHKVDEAIRVEEEGLDKLREQRKVLRKRIVGLEKLKDSFGEERQGGL